MWKSFREHGQPKQNYIFDVFEFQAPSPLADAVVSSTSSPSPLLECSQCLYLASISAMDIFKSSFVTFPSEPGRATTYAGEARHPLLWGLVRQSQPHQQCPDAKESAFNLYGRGLETPDLDQFLSMNVNW